MSEFSARVAAWHGITHVLAFDIETTGPNVVTNWMNEFGAAVFRVGDNEAIEAIYRNIAQPPNTEWDPKTMEEFYKSVPADSADDKTLLDLYEERKKKHAVVSPEKAMTDFIVWARRINDSLLPDEKMIVITDTVAFDTVFFNYYLSKYTPSRCCSLLNLFGKYQVTRDISSFFCGLGRRLGTDGSSRSALNSLVMDKFPAWVEKHKHNHDPLSDAQHIGAMASFMIAAAVADTLIEDSEA